MMYSGITKIDIMYSYDDFLNKLGLIDTSIAKILYAMYVKSRKEEKNGDHSKNLHRI